MKKVLALGTNQFNFVYLLYKSIKQSTPDYSFSCFKLKSFGKDMSYGDVFDTVHQTNVNPFYFLVAAFRSMFQPIYWRTFFFILIVEGKLLKALHFFISWNKERSLFLNDAKLRGYDVYHFHYLQYSYLRMIWFLPKNANVICSFWGSDLLRTSDSFNHYFVSKALSRADIITTQSVELREVILAKFGRTLKDKVRVLKFTLDSGIFNEIDRVMHESRSATKRRIDVPEDRVLITVGHNGSRFNNHLRIIDALGKLSDKEKVFLLIPFTYGIDGDDKAIYKEEIVRALDSAGVMYRIVESYLAAGDMALLRMASDIMIHMPESDALSGAMTETMYAGNIVITGRWLPYSPFQMAGLHYESVDEFLSVPAVINKIMLDVEGEQGKCKANHDLVKKFFYPEVTAKQWVKVLDSISNE